MDFKQYYPQEHSSEVDIKHSQSAFVLGTQLTEDIITVFKLLDTDRDEKLTPKQALRLWGLLGFYVKPAFLTGYTYITIADFLDLSRQMFKDQDITSVSHLFHMMDTHRYGRAKKDDLLTLLKHIGLSVNQDQLECMISRMDSTMNWDRFTEKEFCAFVDYFSKEDIMKHIKA